MSLEHFSRNCRNLSHKCLNALGFYVENPNMPAQNFVLNLADIVFSAIYYGVNIFCLWVVQLDWLVLFLNMLCLIQALIRTTIKRKDCGRKILEVQRDSVSCYFPPYTGLVWIEVFAFGMDFMCAWLLFGSSNLDSSLIFPLKNAITFTIFITFVDGMVSNIENMYQAYPKVVRRA